MSWVFCSEDERFGVSIGQEQLDQLFSLCRQGYPNETGGILIGRYNEQRSLASITAVEPPSRDSRSGRAWFYRGVNGLARSLRKLWNQPSDSREYYIGEWHSHPNSSPRPSHQDRLQMSNLAQTKALYCPEPVLLVWGGRPGGLGIGVYVFFDTGELLELHKK